MNIYDGFYIYEKTWLSYVVWFLGNIKRIILRKPLVSKEKIGRRKLKLYGTDFDFINPYKDIKVIIEELKIKRV